MALKKVDRKNFNTLLDAARAGHLALVECTDKVTGRYVATICACNEGAEIEMVPLAKLFDGNPYDELDPPK